MAGDRGLWVEDLSTHGTLVEMGGTRIELEKNLPTNLALEAVIIMPSRKCARHLQEILRVESLIPTATAPTEEPPSPAAEDESLATTVAVALKTISGEIAGLRLACEGNYTELYQQVASNTTALASHDLETIGLKNVA